MELTGNVTSLCPSCLSVCPHPATSPERAGNALNCVCFGWSRAKLKKYQLVRQFSLLLEDTSQLTVCSVALILQFIYIRGIYFSNVWLLNQQGKLMNWGMDGSKRIMCVQCYVNKGSWKQFEGTSFISPPCCKSVFKRSAAAKKIYLLKPEKIWKTTTASQPMFWKPLFTCCCWLCQGRLRYQ